MVPHFLLRKWCKSISHCCKSIFHCCESTFRLLSTSMGTWNTGDCRDVRIPTSTLTPVGGAVWDATGAVQNSGLVRKWAASLLGQSMTTTLWNRDCEPRLDERRSGVVTSGDQGDEWRPAVSIGGATVSIEGSDSGYWRKRQWVASSQVICWKETGCIDRYDKELRC